MSTISGVNNTVSTMLSGMYQSNNSSTLSTSSLGGPNGNFSAFGMAMMQTMQQLGINPHHLHPHFHHGQGQGSGDNFMQSLFGALSQISTSNTSTSSNPLLSALNILTQDVASGSGLSTSVLDSLNTSFSSFLNNLLDNQSTSSTTTTNITLQAFLQTLTQNLTNDLYANTTNNLLNTTT